MAQVPFDRLVKRVKGELINSLKEAADILKQQMINNAGLTDHTLKELEKLGHPYSIRNTQSLHTPNTLVHKQSGDLVNSIVITTENKKIVVGSDEAVAPHVKYVIEGTAYMIPRDFILQSLKDVEGQMTKAVFKRLSERIRRL